MKLLGLVKSEGKAGHDLAFYRKINFQMNKSLQNCRNKRKNH